MAHVESRWNRPRFDTFGHVWQPSPAEQRPVPKTRSLRRFGFAQASPEWAGWKAQGTRVTTNAGSAGSAGSAGFVYVCPKICWPLHMGFLFAFRFKPSLALPPPLPNWAVGGAPTELR